LNNIRVGRKPGLRPSKKKNRQSRCYLRSKKGGKEITSDFRPRTTQKRGGRKREELPFRRLYCSRKGGQKIIGGELGYRAYEGRKKRRPPPHAVDREGPEFLLPFDLRKKKGNPNCGKGGAFLVDHFTGKEKRKRRSRNLSAAPRVRVCWKRKLNQIPFPAHGGERKESAERAPVARKAIVGSKRKEENSGLRRGKKVHRPGEEGREKKRRVFDGWLWAEKGPHRWG